MSKLRTVVIALLAPVLFVSCSQKKIPNYFDKISARTNALVKFNKATLDIYDGKLEAVLETVVDVTNADTAQRIILREIEFPGGKNASQCFNASVDILDYPNFKAAVSNMLKGAGKTDVPLKFQPADNFRLEYHIDKGFLLIDSAEVEFLPGIVSNRNFADYIRNVWEYAHSGPAKDIAEKQARIEKLKQNQSAALKQKYRFKQLSLGKIEYNVAANSAASENWQVECTFNAVNPNAFACVFSVSFNLLSKNNSVINSFKSEDLIIPAGKSKRFSAFTVLKKFQAERLGNIQGQIFESRPEDPQIVRY